MRKLVEIVRESRRIDTILLIGSLANEATAKTRAEELAAVTGETEQPIILSTYTTATEGAMAAFAEAGIPCYTSMPSCARAIRALVDYARFQARRHRPAPAATSPRERTLAANGLRAFHATRHPPDEAAAKPILAGYGVPRPNEHVVHDEAEAVAAAARIGGPVALKVQSPDIAHKTEAGAVALGIEGEKAVREAYRRVLSNAATALPGRPHRLRAGAGDGAARRRDHPRHDPRPGFRPDADGRARRHPCRGFARRGLLTVPIGPDEALALIDELKGAALLDGVRGTPPADRAALAELIAALSRFAADHADQIEEIDLNPVIVHPQGQGLSVVDALIVKRQTANS